MEFEEDMGGVRDRIRVEGLNWHWKPFEFLTQDAEPSGTTLVDASNGFNEMSRLEMMWSLGHRWPAGARFAPIAIGIGHNLSSASRGSRQSQS